MSAAGGLNGTRQNEKGEILVYDLENVETKNFDFGAGQSDATIITPAAGKKIEIHGIYANTASKTVDIELDFLSSGIKVFKLYTSNAQAGGEAGISSLRLKQTFIIL